MAVMMKCGHTANAKSADGTPCCAICVGLNPDAKVVAEAPDLSGRQAKCPYCNNIKPSSTDLAFFEHRPTKEYDSYYDGCRGWD